MGEIHEEGAIMLDQPARSLRRFALCAAAVISCLLLHPGARAGDRAGSTSGAATEGHACTRMSDAAHRACGHSLQDDFWTAVGRCENLSDPDARKTCLATARQDLSDGRDDCAAQHKARLGLCKTLGQSAYQPAIDPAQFVSPAEIGTGVAPNPFFPLRPGETWTYAGGGETNIVTVTGEIKTILGVDCAVVHDVVKVGDEVTENTLDWLAQDVDGNVWYFGENTQELASGEILDIEGSWKAGVDGAEPGIVMKAAPAVGDLYRQEFLLGVAEDIAETTSLTGTETVPAATCTGSCLVSQETSPLEPDALEDKFYLSGVGLILTVDLETGVREELIEHTLP